MLNLLELALNNNYIYLGIISVLIIIIILTILSIKKDRDEAIRKRRNSYMEPKNEEEKNRARLELEKVVSDMEKNLEGKEDMASDIKTYEQEQEEKAIISYQELVEAVRTNNTNGARNEVGMEVADTNSIEPAETVEEKSEPEEESELKEEIEPKEEKTFQTSEFISPIYGVSPQQTKKEEEEEEKEEKEMTMDDIIDEDFEEEDEFLDSLKDFRMKL